MRVLAVVIGLLLVSSLGSVLLLRAALFDALDDEVEDSVTREAEEFRLLAAGNNPLTGDPFDGDVPAIFDVYFEREIPDEGESLLAFVDGELYRSARAQGGGTAAELQPASDYWLSLDDVERGEIETAFGTTQYVAVPLRGADRDGLFVVANFPDFERGEIDAAVRTQIVVQLATLLLASLLAVALAGRVLRPLRSLASTARKISDTDLTHRIPVTGKDELSLITAAFNDMLARLERAFTTLREFLDDASHELRTPLTVIRGHIDMLELDAAPHERRAAIDVINDEIDRMSQIVNDLFLLARARQPDFLHVEEVDLRDVVAGAHQKATVLADRNWRLEAPRSTPVTIDRHRLTQAVLQLAENAVKFTTADQPIAIGGAVGDGRLRVWVDDGGAGVAPQDAERIFARFGRGDQARRDTAGVGLGLSIVDAIAEAHHGAVRLVQRPGPGARFEITIPVEGGT